MRKPGIVVALCLLLGVVAAAAGYRLWIRFPPGAGLIEDDGYFYAQIAYQLGTAGRSSFDGFTTTDGYHLLWGWGLAGVSALMGLFSADKHLHLGAMLALYFFVVALTAGLHAQSWAGRAAIALFATLYSGLTEGPLVALLLLTCVRGLYLERDHSDVRAALLAAGLLPLARIDVAVLLVPLALWLPPPRRRALVMVAGLGVLAHFAALLAIDGHLVSVAARLKIGDLARAGVGQNLDKFTALYALVALAVGLALASARGAAGWDPRRSLHVLYASTAYLVCQIVVNRNVRYWYYMPFLMLAAALADRVARGAWRRALGAGLAALVVGALAFKVVYTRRYAADRAYAAAFVAALPAHVPPQGRIFALDGAGYLGYFSGRSVFAGDGLVASHAYADRVAARQLGGFLAENQIQYLVSNRYEVATDRGAPFLLRYAGLAIARSAARPLLTPPPGLHKLVAFTLYRLD